MNCRKYVTLINSLFDSYNKIIGFLFNIYNGLVNK